MNPSSLLLPGASLRAWPQEASFSSTTTLTGGIMSTRPATDGTAYTSLAPSPGGDVPWGLLPLGIANTSECNLNLLKEAKYFLKLIAIFVDFA